MDPLTVVGLFLLAGFVGVYGTIIGAGGGFVLIPGLVLLFGFEGVEAVGTGAVALAVIGATGTIAYDREGLVDRPAAALFSLTALPISFVVGWKLAERVDAEVFIAVLGVLLLVLAVFVVFVPSAGEGESESTPQRPIPLAASGAGVGVMSGLFGVGGGLVTVPIMASVRKHSAHRAAATTAATSMVTALGGTAGRAIAGHVDWAAAGVMVVGAAIGSWAGAVAAGKLEAKTVQVLLAIGLIAAGVPLIVDAF